MTDPALEPTPKPPEETVVRWVRRSGTLRLMLLVLSAAIFLGTWVAIINGIERWEGTRTAMYHRGEVTRDLLINARRLMSSDNANSLLLSATLDQSNTRRWTLELRQAESGGSQPGRVCAIISGALIDKWTAMGPVELSPITIELKDPARDSPWLAPLLDTYNDNGWSYEIVKPSASDAKDQP